LIIIKPQKPRITKKKKPTIQQNPQEMMLFLIATLMPTIALLPRIPVLETATTMRDM
jgi:hypothetical protein